MAGLALEIQKIGKIQKSQPDAGGPWERVQPVDGAWWRVRLGLNLVIYHLSFSIFHLSFWTQPEAANSIEKMTNGKWKMTNGKCLGCLRIDLRLLRRGNG
jgi:hypothetical protein